MNKTIYMKFDCIILGIKGKNKFIYKHKPYTRNRKFRISGIQKHNCSVNLHNKPIAIGKTNLCKYLEIITWMMEVGRKFTEVTINTILLV